MNKVIDIIVLTVGRLMIGLTSMVIVRLITTFLSPGEVGRLNIILSIYGWFCLVLLSPVGMYANRKFIEWREAGIAKKNFLRLCKYTGGVALFSAVLLAVMNNYRGVGIRIDTIWLIGLIIGNIIIVGNNFGLFGYMNLFGRRKLFIFFNLVALWMGALFSLLFVKMSPTAELWLGGQLMAQGIVFIFAMIVFWNILSRAEIKIKDNDKSFGFKVVFGFAWPMVIVNFLYWLHSQGYRFIFKGIAGEESLGLFVVGFGIGVSLMTAFDLLFNQYYHPLFYREISNADDEQRTNAWNRYALAFFPAIIVFLLYVVSNNRLIIKIFTGSGFHSVGYIIIWGAFAESLRMMFSATSMVAHAQIEMKPVILPGVTGVIMALSGIFLLGRIDPFIGSGVALMAGWGGALVHIYISMRRLLPIRIAWRRIFYSLFLGSPLIISCLMSNRFFKDFSTFQALTWLLAGGIYLLLAEFILARKWLSLAVKLPLLDKFEQKVSCYLSRGYGIFR